MEEVHIVFALPRDADKTVAGGWGTAGGFGTLDAARAHAERMAADRRFNPVEGVLVVSATPAAEGSPRPVRLATHYFREGGWTDCPADDAPPVNDGDR